MLKTILAAATALALVSGIAMAEDVTTETTKQSTGIGPLRFETDKTVRSSDHMGAAGDVHVEKNKSVTKDWDGETTSKTKSESTTIR